jgi:sugar lactone lactonase YvrE
LPTTFSPTTRSKIDGYLLTWRAKKAWAALDGVRVDSNGNVYAAATGGLWIISPAGKRLGKIPGPEGIRFANLAFGDPDGKTLLCGQCQKLMASPSKDSGLSP